MPIETYIAAYQPCANPRCWRCREKKWHGPYWTAYWIEGLEVKSRYIGANLPAEKALPTPIPGEIYVYVLCEPDGAHDVRYVGVTANPVVRRSQHLTPSGLKKKAGPALAEWLTSLRKQDEKPLMLFVEKVPRADYKEAEQKWITFFQERGADLTNISPGGWRWAEESRVKYNASWTPEARQKKSDELKKFWADPEKRAQRITQQTGKRLAKQSKITGF